MPTAAKLFAAVALALAGFFTGALVLQYLPGVAWGGRLPLTAASIGLLLGWQVIGRSVGRGMWLSAQAGMRAAVYLVILVLFFLGTLQMIRWSVRMRYDGPFEALTDIVGQGLDMGAAALRPDVVIVLFLGGALAGIASEWAHRRWI